MLANTGVKITSEGRPYLGVPIGTDDFVESFVSTKVQEWVAQLEKLALIACSQPHAAYAAFTHGLISKWTFLSRTLKNISSRSFKPLEMIISSKLIPALTNRSPPSDEVRNLFALPARLGGIAIADPSVESDDYDYSLKIQPLVDAIIQQMPSTVLQSSSFR